MDYVYTYIYIHTHTHTHIYLMNGGAQIQIQGAPIIQEAPCKTDVIVYKSQKKVICIQY